MKKLLLLILLASAGWLTTLGAEDRIFRFLTFYEGSQKDKALGSLMATLARSSDRIVLIPIELQKDKPALDDRALKNLAQRKSCDGAIFVSLVENADGWTVGVKVLIPGEEKPRFMKFNTKATPTWNDVAEIFWLYLLGELETFLTQEGSEFPKPMEALTSHLNIKGVPGTLVRGLTKEPFLIPSEGQIKLEVNFPASYFIESSMVGYRSEGLTLFLTDAEKDITLTQTLERVFTAEYFHYNFSYPSVEASWFYLPGQGSISLGITQFIAGFILRESSGSTPSPSLTGGLPLVQLSLGGTWFFSPPEDLIRFNAGLNLGLRFMTSPNIELDTILPFAIQPFGGVEYRPFEYLGVEVMVGPTIFAPVQSLTGYKTLIGARKSGILIADAIGLEPFYMRVGVRWYIW